MPGPVHFFPDAATFLTILGGLTFHIGLLNYEQNVVSKVVTGLRCCRSKKQSLEKLNKHKNKCENILDSSLCVSLLYCFTERLQK